MAKKKDKTIKKRKDRDKLGKFLPGSKGGPGRPPGKPSDLFPASLRVRGKDGKKKSPGDLRKDMYEIYGRLGAAGLIEEWAKHSHQNLTKFIDILCKMEPPTPAAHQPDITFEASERYMPKLTIEKVITEQRPGEHGGPKMIMPRPKEVIDKKMKEMEQRLKIAEERAEEAERKYDELVELDALSNEELEKIVREEGGGEEEKK